MVCGHCKKLRTNCLGQGHNGINLHMNFVMVHLLLFNKKMHMGKGCQSYMKMQGHPMTRVCHPEKVGQSLLTKRRNEIKQNKTKKTPLNFGAFQLLQF